MDEKNRRILKILQENGRIAHTQLASMVNLSPPAVLARVRKLEEKGVITGYQAVVDPTKMGHGVTSYVGVSLVHHQREPRDQIAERLRRLPQVLEAYHLTGEIDYLLKIAVPSIEALERFLMEDLSTIPGLDKIHTNVVLSTIKTNGVVPIADEIAPSPNQTNGHHAD